MKDIKHQGTVIIVTAGIISMILLAFIPHAFAIPDVYFYTPLQLQLTPSQNWLDLEARNSLIATYGILLVNSCIDAEPRCKDVTSADRGVANCLHLVQLDLAQGTMQGCQSPCPSDYVRSSKTKQCVTRAQLCKYDYGNNSVWTGKLSDTGVTICDCEQGYVISLDGTNFCIAQTPSGTLCNGKYWNDCPTGQKFNCPSTGDAQCLTDQPIKSNYQICKDKYGNNSVWSGKLNDKGGALCDCIQGFVWNANGTTCVIQTPSGTLCNGKYWSTCPVGQNFYCPPTGNAQCVENEKPVAPASTTNNISPITTPPQTKSPAIKNDQTKPGQTPTLAPLATEVQGAVVKDESCPPNSSRKNNSCVCDNGYQYDIARMECLNTEMKSAIQGKTKESTTDEPTERVEKPVKQGFFSKVFGSIRNFFGNIFK